MKRIETKDKRNPNYWNRGRTASYFVPVSADYKPSRGRVVDHVGRRFGRLVALRICGRMIDRKRPTCGQAVWRCQCDCGKVSEVISRSLIDGSTKSCGCLYLEGKWSVPSNKLGIGESAFNQLFSSYKRSARARGYTFSLSKSDFRALTESNCHYCGTTPEAKFHAAKGTNGDFIGSGVDRLNNREGYVYLNCVPCCKQCNIAKGVLSMDEFASWLMRATHWARMYASLGHEPFNLSEREISEAEDAI